VSLQHQLQYPVKVTDAKTPQCQLNREPGFPLYDGPDISKFGIYLTVALNRSHESHKLVDLLKGDGLRNLALKQKYFTDIFNISDEISRYILVNNVYISDLCSIDTRLSP
jgi:hypothetical protein